MKYGLTETTIEKIRSVFVRFSEIDKAVLYGSRAKGNYKTGSDIDLTLYGTALTSDLLSAITSLLDDLMLPYTIDLSLHDEISHAKLREHIKRVGVVFYEQASRYVALGEKWQTKQFEECIEKVTYTPKIQRKDFLEEGVYPIISQEDTFINGYWNNEEDLFTVATPVVVFGDHTKVLKYIDFDFVLGADGVRILQPQHFLLPKFFYYQLQAVNIESLGYARHYKLLKELEIVYPTRIEQQRIVDILDNAFDEIAIAKDNAEKNLHSARALFDSHLHIIFEDAWRSSELVTLANLASDITDGDHMPPPKSSDGIPFITIGNIVKETRKIDFADTFMVPYEYYNGLKPNKKPQKGDILYTVTGSFGIPVPVAGNAEFCFQRHIGLIRPKPDICSTWLCYLLMSPQVMEQAEDGATGTAQRTVSLKLLRNFKVPRVTPLEQQVAAAKLDAIHAETQGLISIYRRKRAALDELKKSLLHKAFSGEL